MITEEQKLRARREYIEMKRKAGVPEGKEFLIIINGQLVPASEEEFIEATKGPRMSQEIDTLKDECSGPTYCLCGPCSQGEDPWNVRVGVSDKYNPGSVSCT